MMNGDGHLPIPIDSDQLPDFVRKWNRGLRYETNTPWDRDVALIQIMAALERIEKRLSELED